MTTRSRDTERTRRASSSDRSDRPIADRAKRAASAAVGGALVVGGLRRRSLSGAGAALVGGWLMSRALGSRPDPDGQDVPTRPTGPVTFSRSKTVGASADECYETWRDPDQLSRIMAEFADVTRSGDDRFRWTVHGPLGRDVSWETRIAEAEPGEVLRWETPPDATLPNEGEVRFRPAAGDRGTVVTLSLSFDPPGGAVGGTALDRLGVVPETLAGEALGRFKSLVESGEIPTTEANPSARGSGDLI
ncbi:SRPBCC family protein [Halorussus marinus]|uniref:SRPBCC family protein n=1 Tax=Halorussus marinus TaxID=2505976 RepID=UPI00106E888A|nr:SRPBCC family protein [Halorussus marinus]